MRASMTFLQWIHRLPALLRARPSRRFPSSRTECSYNSSVNYGVKSDAQTRYPSSDARPTAALSLIAEPLQPSFPISTRGIPLSRRNHFVVASDQSLRGAEHVFLATGIDHSSKNNASNFSVQIPLTPFGNTSAHIG